MRKSGSAGTLKLIISINVLIIAIAGLALYMTVHASELDAAKLTARTSDAITRLSEASASHRDPAVIQEMEQRVKVLKRKAEIASLRLHKIHRIAPVIFGSIVLITILMSLIIHFTLKMWNHSETVTCQGNEIILDTNQQRAILFVNGQVQDVSLARNGAHSLRGRIEDSQTGDSHLTIDVKTAMFPGRRTLYLIDHCLMKPDSRGELNPATPEELGLL